MMHSRTIRKYNLSFSSEEVFVFVLCSVKFGQATFFGIRDELIIIWGMSVSRGCLLSVSLLVVGL